MAHFKFTKKMIVELVFALITAASLSVTTFAWFSMQSTVTVSFWDMVVAENLKVNLKYCVHNKTTETDSSGATVVKYPGYNDPRPPVTTDDSLRKTITDYSSQFIAIADNKFVADGPLDIKDLEPGTCHTFAFEIICPAGASREVKLSLKGFSSPGSTKNYLSGSTSTPICLASAIDMYTQAQAYSTDNATNTTFANTFITSYMTYGPTDQFVYYDATETPRADGYVLWTGTIAGGATELVLFTLEFTDMDATYYSYTSTDGTKDYYTRSADGDSNCYRDLSFNITDLYVG
jgi:hypothetical protein